LSVIRQAFLLERGHHALLQLALGKLDADDCRKSSRMEQEIRIRFRVAAGPAPVSFRSFESNTRHQGLCGLLSNRQSSESGCSLGTRGSSCQAPVLAVDLAKLLQRALLGQSSLIRIPDRDVADVCIADPCT
jgi:hypothetical protein